jgi:hypothetical protein
MKPRGGKRTALLMLAGGWLATAGVAAPPAAPALTGFPFQDEELTYTLKWPGGLSLGEGRLKAKHNATSWDFTMSLDGSIPGFDVKDNYNANAPGDLCTAMFERTSTHGPRKTAEKETIDSERGVVKRETLKGGGSSELPVSPCVRDALTFLFYSRRELGQGRVPAAREILFGNLYRTQMDYAGAETVTASGKSEVSDKVAVTMKGPASSFRFEMYFARDAARTPLLIKVPLTLGTFSMELVR